MKKSVYFLCLILIGVLSISIISALSWSDIRNWADNIFRKGEVKFSPYVEPPASAGPSGRYEANGQVYVTAPVDINADPVRWKWVCISGCDSGGAEGGTGSGAGGGSISETPTTPSKPSWTPGPFYGIFMDDCNREDSDRDWIGADRLSLVIKNGVEQIERTKNYDAPKCSPHDCDDNPFNDPDVCWSEILLGKKYNKQCKYIVYEGEKNVGGNCNKNAAEQCFGISKLEKCEMIPPEKGDSRYAWIYCSYTFDYSADRGLECPDRKIGPDFTYKGVLVSAEEVTGESSFGEYGFGKTYEIFEKTRENYDKILEKIDCSKSEYSVCAKCKQTKEQCDKIAKCADKDGDYIVMGDISDVSKCGNVCGLNHNEACQGANDCDNDKSDDGSQCNDLYLTTLSFKTCRGTHQINVNTCPKEEDYSKSNICAAFTDSELLRCDKNIGKAWCSRIYNSPCTESPNCAKVDYYYGYDTTVSTESCNFACSSDPKYSSCAKCSGSCPEKKCATKPTIENAEFGSETGAASEGQNWAHKPSGDLEACEWKCEEGYKKVEGKDECEKVCPSFGAKTLQTSGKICRYIGDAGCNLGSKLCTISTKCFDVLTFEQAKQKIGDFTYKLLVSLDSLKDTAPEKIIAFVNNLEESKRKKELFIENEAQSLNDVQLKELEYELNKVNTWLDLHLSESVVLKISQINYEPFIYDDSNGVKDEQKKASVLSISIGF